MNNASTATAVIATATAVIATATVLIDPEAYVTKGATGRHKGTSASWAEKFRALGGQATSVRVPWQTGAPGVTFTITGTDAALEFALATATA